MITKDRSRYELSIDTSHDRVSISPEREKHRCPLETDSTRLTDKWDDAENESLLQSIDNDANRFHSFICSFLSTSRPAVSSAGKRRQRLSVPRILT